MRLIALSYVKPYVRRSKTDAADAEAICVAVGRSNMRFVPVMSATQRAALLHHRARDLLVRQRTMLINALRGRLAEFGTIAPSDVTASPIYSTFCRTPTARKRGIGARSAQKPDCGAACIEQRIAAIEVVIVREKANPVSRRLATIPGNGPATASAISATITDPSAFKSSCELAPWIGLLPRRPHTTRFRGHLSL